MTDAAVGSQHIRVLHIVGKQIQILHVDIGRRIDIEGNSVVVHKFRLVKEMNRIGMPGDAVFRIL